MHAFPQHGHSRPSQQSALSADDTQRHDKSISRNIQPDHPGQIFITQTATAAWIAMIVTELHLEYDACTLDWFPPGSMWAKG